MLDKVQEAASDLIKADARFVNTLVHMQQNGASINSNYIMMCLPYIGILADGAEQWCKKVGQKAPTFNRKEKEFYTVLRQSHKLFEISYEDYETLVVRKLHESDEYFFKTRSLLSKIVRYYYNVGVDYCNEAVCGNTILCSMYLPSYHFSDKEYGPKIKELSVVAGEIAAHFLEGDLRPYTYDDQNFDVRYKDYHFYEKCPLKLKNNLGLILFCILCSINYTIEFIDKYFTQEIPQKFKFAYLQYYYLCDFLDELNSVNKTDYYINKTLKNRELRNCLAHYGLGQFLKEQEVDNDDILKGLTQKAFKMEYSTCKALLYKYLQELENQIRERIF